MQALKRLDDQARQLERTTKGPSLEPHLAGRSERGPLRWAEGRVFGWEADPLPKRKPLRPTL
jgi:uncharacterized protein